MAVAEWETLPDRRPEASATAETQDITRREESLT
jgi:hypothetical protein